MIRLAILGGSDASSLGLPAPLPLISGEAFRPSAIGAEPAVCRLLLTAAEGAVRERSRRLPQGALTKRMSTPSRPFGPPRPITSTSSAGCTRFTRASTRPRSFRKRAFIRDIAPKTETQTIRFATPEVAIEDGTFDRIGPLAGPRRKDATRPCG